MTHRPLYLLLLASGLGSPALADPVDPAEYFPLPDGATWTYDTELGQNTMQIQPGTVDIAGVPTKELRQIAGDEVGSGIFYTNTDGIQRHAEYDAVEDALGTYDPPVVHALNPAELGDSFSGGGQVTISVSGAGSITLPYTFDWEITAAGPMETPAGFFCDVVVYEQTIDFDSGFFTITETDYLVRGVGLVAVQGFDDGAFFATLTDSTLSPPPDADCDARPDSEDLCPAYAQTDGTADADGNGTGDECECGDQTGNGRVDIEDIIAINRVLFGLEPESPLCDANEDGACNIEDILAVNARIFGAETHCARNPS